MRALFEDTWLALPDGLEPPDWDARRRFLLGHVRPGARALDLGCGEGRFTAELARAGAQAIGADVAEAALRRARARHPEQEFERIPYDGPLPWGEGSFDLVWASEVLERAGDTERFLAEVRRVLRPDGVLLVTTPSAGRVRTLVEGVPDPAGDRLHLYTSRTLGRVLRDAGFARVELSRLGRRRGRLGATARAAPSGQAL